MMETSKIKVMYVSYPYTSDPYGNSKKIAKIAPTLNILFFLFVFISLGFIMLSGVPENLPGMILVAVIFI